MGVDLSELKSAITGFVNESNDNVCSIDQEIEDLTAKQVIHRETLVKLKAADNAPKEHFGEQLREKFVNDDAAVATQGKQFQKMAVAREAEFQAMKKARTSELEHQEEQYKAMNDARAAEYKAMTEARTSVLELRKNQSLADLVKREEEDADTNDRYLRTLIRIKKRRTRHNGLHANTKTVVGHVQTALSGIVTNTDQQAKKVLKDANAHAEEITKAARTHFETQHGVLENKHNELDGKVTTNKEAVEDALEAAEEKTANAIKTATAVLEEKLNATNTDINEQLGKHDTNHEITKKHILYVDRKNDKPKEVQDKHFLDEYQGQWQDRPVAEDKPAGEPVAGGAKKVEYQDCCGVNSFTDMGMCEDCKQPGTPKTARRRLASDLVSMTPSEQVLARRRLTNRPKSHIVVLEALLEEINRLN